MDDKKLAALKKDIKHRGSVDREHLLEFLRLLPTNDGDAVAKEVRQWLQSLHEDPELERVQFPQGDIDAILSDLGSYGRLSPETTLHLQQKSNSRELEP